jgi:hypothetical protein
MSTHLVWEHPSIAAGDIYLPQYITLPTPQQSPFYPIVLTSLLPAPSWGRPLGFHG